MASPGDPPLRIGLAADARALHALEQAAFDSDRMSLRSIQRLLRRPSARFLLLHSPEGALLGALCLLFRKGSRRCRIYSVAVTESHRGLGLGRRLCQAAEREGRELGCRIISLEVRQSNTAAIRMYEGMGYQRGDALPAFYEDGGDGWRYTKRLVLGPV